MLQKYLLLFSFGYALLGASVGAQESPDWGNTICPPPPKSEMASPDNRWTILSTGAPDPRIWIVDNTKGGKRFLLDCQASISVGWAPDSKTFFINDHQASNVDDAFLYDALTLKMINIGKLIAASDSQVVRYLNAGHHYVDVKRWINAHEVMVDISGHFDSPPAESFEFHYSVGLDGKVSKME